MVRPGTCPMDCAGRPALAAPAVCVCGVAGGGPATSLCCCCCCASAAMTQACSWAGSQFNWRTNAATAAGNACCWDLSSCGCGNRHAHLLECTAPGLDVWLHADWRVARFDRLTQFTLGLTPECSPEAHQVHVDPAPVLGKHLLQCRYPQICELWSEPAACIQVL